MKEASHASFSCPTIGIPSSIQTSHIFRTLFTQLAISKLARVRAPEASMEESQFLSAQTAAGTHRHIAAVGSPFDKFSETGWLMVPH